MRIAVFAPYDLARPGGVATHIRAQARALRARGHEASVFGPASAPLRDGERALSSAVAITFGGTESGLGLSPLAARAVRALFRRERFDVVHVHEPLTPLLPWFALRASPAPLVGTFHVHREEGHRLYPVARRLLAPLVARVSRRIAVSEAARQTVAAHFPGTYDIVPNGVDVDVFREPRPRPAAMRGGRNVVFVGRLEPRKGVEHLVDAMARVRPRHPDARLVVVGDGPARSTLDSAARAAGVEATFVGRVDDAELPGYFQSADIVCSPATGGESFGIVLLEALSCGTPIVATQIDGYRALVGDAACGRLVPPGDAPALAAGIDEMLSNEDERRRCGARGLAVARAYDWAVIARRLETIYEEALDSTRDRARRGTTTC
ncbi:MAG TPA: glycosyltransferase family 4 protein [Vicinamibacterales bacterium]|nr:glycosyltransferase family 4 protein [Vicinamibacterales bacterium]